MGDPRIGAKKKETSCNDFSSSSFSSSDESFRFRSFHKTEANFNAILCLATPLPSKPYTEIVLQNFANCKK